LYYYFELLALLADDDENLYLILTNVFMLFLNKLKLDDAGLLLILDSLWVILDNGLLAEIVRLVSNFDDDIITRQLELANIDLIIIILSLVYIILKTLK